MRDGEGVRDGEVIYHGRATWSAQKRGDRGGQELRYCGRAGQYVIEMRMWILTYPIQDADDGLAEILMDGDVVVSRPE
jgi:hypothetical protein